MPLRWVEVILKDKATLRSSLLKGFFFYNPGAAIKITVRVGEDACSVYYYWPLKTVIL